MKRWNPTFFDEVNQVALLDCQLIQVLSLVVIENLHPCKQRKFRVVKVYILFMETNMGLVLRAIYF